MSPAARSSGFRAPLGREASRGRQRGVALIIALILVALAAVLASKMTFDGFLERQRAMSILAAEQAFQFAMGAEALAADVLVQDGQASSSMGGGATTLAGLWAQPVPPFPITPTNDPEGEPIGMLQGKIEDMQARFNLNNLAHILPGGATKQPTEDPLPLAQFERLLKSVGLDTKWAAIARDWIDPDDAPGPQGAEDQVYTSQNPPYRAGNWPMMSPSELMNMPGFTAEMYRKIAPYVTALPMANAKINICTAPAAVLQSISEKAAGEYTDKVLAAGRKSGCFPDAPSFRNIIGTQDSTRDNAAQSWDVKSQYFRLTTQVTLGTTEVTLYTLLWRSGSAVTPVIRSFGTP